MKEIDWKKVDPGDRHSDAVNETLRSPAPFGESLMDAIAREEGCNPEDLSWDIVRLGEPQNKVLLGSAQLVYGAAKGEWGVGWEHLSEYQQMNAVAYTLVNNILSIAVPAGSPLEDFQLLVVKSLRLCGSTEEAVDDQ